MTQSLYTARVGELFVSTRSQARLVESHRSPTWYGLVYRDRAWGQVSEKLHHEVLSRSLRLVFNHLLVKSTQVSF